MSNYFSIKEYEVSYKNNKEIIKGKADSSVKYKFFSNLVNSGIIVIENTTKDKAFKEIRKQIQAKKLEKDGSYSCDKPNNFGRIKYSSQAFNQKDFLILNINPYYWKKN